MLFVPQEKAHMVGDSVNATKAETAYVIDMVTAIHGKPSDDAP